MINSNEKITLKLNDFEITVESKKIEIAQAIVKEWAESVLSMPDPRPQYRERMTESTEEQNWARPLNPQQEHNGRR